MTKREQELYDFKWEVKNLNEHPNTKFNWNKISHLAKAFDLVTKNTLFEEDAQDLINMCCPEYNWDDEQYEREQNSLGVDKE